jgi:hypothetical protein
MIWEEKNLRKMYQQAKDLDLRHLLTGLTILVKDTADFINSQGYSDDVTEAFRLAYLEMMNHDRYYWSKFGPDLYKDISDTKLPAGIIKAIREGTFDLEPLIKADIKTEWAKPIGWYFFKNYSRQNRSLILDGRSVDQLREKICEAKDPADPFVAMVDRLSHSTTYVPGFLYPVMLYISLLLKVTDFTTIDEN